MITRPRSVAVGLVVLALVLMSGCRDGAGPSTAKATTARPPSSALTLAPVSLPATLRSTMSFIQDIAAVPPFGAHGGDVLSIETDTDGTTIAAIRAGTALATPLPLPVQSPLIAVSGAGPLGTMVAGSRLDAQGKRAAYALISADRRTWTPKPVDTGGRDLRITSVAVGVDRVVLTARDGAGAAYISSSAWSASATFGPLPEPAAGQPGGTLSVAAHGRAFVVTQGMGPKGSADTPVASLSTDDGVRWAAFRAMGAANSGSVSGVVWSGTDYVATGQVYRTQQGATGYDPGVWRSRDGATWHRDFAYGPLFEDGGQSAADYDVGIPIAAAGTVSAVVSCSGCDNTWILTPHHDARAGWLWTSGPRGLQDNGLEPTSVVWPTKNGPRLVTLEKGLLTSYAARGKSAELAPSAITKEQTRPWLDDLIDVGGRTLGSGTRSDFIRHDGSWTQTTTGVPFVLDGRTLRGTAWTPAGLAGLAGLVAATDPTSGASVVIGTKADLTAGRWHSQGLARASTTAAWTPFTMPAVDTFQWVDSVIHIKAGGWLAAARIDNANAPESDQRAAQIYSSPDGVHWKADKGDYSRGSSASGIGDLCALPDGSPIAVGWRQTADRRETRATLWRPGTSGWQPTEVHSSVGTSYATGCATTAGATTVSGAAGGDDVTWTTAGSSLVAPAALPPGVERDRPQAWAGGLVAGGSLDTAEHVGPVVWWSPDGKTWHWQPVSTADSASSADVHVVGTRAYAVANGASLTQVWELGRR